MIFDEAAHAYMIEKTKRLRANTLEGYRSALERHLRPRWSGVALEDIATEDIQAWVDGFEMPGAAEKAYKTLRQIIRWAIRRLGVRIYDPTAGGVELPRRAAYRPRVLDAGQLRSMLRGMWGAREEAVAIIGATLGARRGEACAVDLEHGIDWRTGEVHLGPSLQVVGGEMIMMPPKTPKSDRVSVLPAFALRRLRSLFPRSQRRGLVSRGDRPDAIARRMRSACRRASVPSVPPTQLRHTWATLAVEAGVGIETVAMMLGHAGIGVAYEHYIVPRRSICRTAQRAVERLIMAA